MAPYREQAIALYQAGVEGTAIWERLKERGYAGSLSAIYQFLAHLDHRGPAATVRANGGAHAGCGRVNRSEIG